MAEATKKPATPKTKNWTLQNVETRGVATYLNKITAAGAVVFNVYQSTDVGGTYAVLSYTEE